MTCEKLSDLERRETREEIEQSASVDMVTSTECTLTIHFKTSSKAIRTTHYEGIVPNRMKITHVNFEKQKIEFSVSK